MRPELVERRKAEDASFFADPRQWPGPTHVHVKTQPWVEPERFGVLVEVHPGADSPHRYQVMHKGDDGRFTGEPVESFGNLADLVERWSPD